MTLWQKIEITAVLALLSSCGAVACAAPATPAQVAHYDRVKCEVSALEPLALQDADFIVASVEDGVVGVDDLLATVGEVKANVDAVKAAFKLCRAQFPVLEAAPAQK